MHLTHTRTTHTQVMYTTAFSTAISFIGAVGSNQLIPSLAFVIRNPDALWYILALCASSTAMQVCAASVDFVCHDFEWLLLFHLLALIDGLHFSVDELSCPSTQVIISYTIKSYGALAFATVMTTRQFFSILVSSIVFWTPLMKGQW